MRKLLLLLLIVINLTGCKMSEIYNIDFETGDFSEFDTDTTGGAQLYVSSTDAISGTYSCNHDWSTSLYRVTNSTNISLPFTVFHLGFRMKIKAGWGFGSASSASLFTWLNGGTEYRLSLIASGGDVVMRLDGNVPTMDGTVNLNDGNVHTVELRAVRGVGDGSHHLYIDSSLDVEQTGLNNDVDFSNIRTTVNPSGNWVLSNPRNLAGDSSGGVITDNWGLRDDDTFIFPSGPSTDEFDAAIIAKPCAISMDGDFIYIACLDSLGQPALIKFASDLGADGSVVFQPGAGTDIGVQTGKKDADVVWIAGDFGGTDTVEKSEDAGTSFNVKDDASFDPVTSFVVGPDSDERVLIFTDAGASVASAEIHETIDDGASWSQKNSGLGFVSKDVARLDINVEELVTGNEAGASDNIDYSPNTGQDLEDYSTGFPTQDVTKVIVG
jgi:hypothetical protein